MKTLRKYALAAGLVIAAPILAYAAGLFPGFPIVGGAAYCTSFVLNPLTGLPTTTCNGPTVPAGPTIITGSELIPADTQLSQGRAPQTVLLKMAGLGVGPYQYNAPASAASLTVAAGENQLIIEPAGTIAALTVTLPAATLLVDNQRWGFCSTQIVTTLTLTAGSGTTVSGAPTAAVVPVTTGGGSCPEWVYRQTNTTWYRIH